MLIAKPAKSGSIFFDCKTHFSVIMLALVDADYKFLYIDAGAVGRSSDAGVWDKCSLKAAIDQKLLNILPTNKPPYSEKVCPSVVVGDDAFPLKGKYHETIPWKKINY